MQLSTTININIRKSLDKSRFFGAYNATKRNALRGKRKNHRTKFYEMWPFKNGNKNIVEAIELLASSVIGKLEVS